MKNAFHLGEKLPYFFTIHYYLLPQKIPRWERLVKSEEKKNILGTSPRNFLCKGYEKDIFRELQ